MQSRGACLLLSCLACSAACGGSSSDSDPANHGGSSRSDEPIDYGFVTVTANGSAMNRACNAGCEWELAAGATGSVTVSDSAGTEFFDLSASESDALLAAVGDEHFVQALREQKPCVDVTDGSLMLSATWESLGTLVQEDADGCALTSDGPYFPVLQVLLQLHAAHFNSPCDAVVEGQFGRALCFLLPR